MPTRWLGCRACACDQQVPGEDFGAGACTPGEQGTPPSGSPSGNRAQLQAADGTCMAKCASHMPMGGTLTGSWIGTLTGSCQLDWQCDRGFVRPVGGKGKSKTACLLHVAKLYPCTDWGSITITTTTCSTCWDRCKFLLKRYSNANAECLAQVWSCKAGLFWASR